MKYIICDDDKILETYEINGGDYVLTYPPYKTESVTVDSNIWQDVVDNPESYTYKDGQLIKLDT